MTRDWGRGPPPDDWLKKCGLDKVGPDGVQSIGLFVDQSGSMTKSTVKNSYNFFVENTKKAGLTVCEVTGNTKEEWIIPFVTTLTPNSGTCTSPTKIV